MQQLDAPKTIDQFLSKWAIPVPESGCWLWSGRLRGSVYGGVDVNGKCKSAHRVAYELAFGPIPEGMFVCHKCDVPICVNPAHLFVGTPKQNSEDMTAKQRQARGERLKHSRFTPRDVVLIRADRRGGRVIAKEYGVAKAAIDKIRSGRSWKHVA